MQKRPPPSALSLLQLAASCCLPYAMLTAICAGEAEGAAASVLNQANETLMTLATKKTRGKS